MGLRKGRIAFSAWTVPVLASIETSDIEFKVDLLADSEFFKLFMVVDGKLNFLALPRIKLFFYQLFVNLKNDWGGRPVSLNFFVENYLCCDVVSVVPFLQILLELVWVQTAGQQWDRIFNVAYGIVQIGTLKSKVPFFSHPLQKIVEFSLWGHTSLLPDPTNRKCRIGRRRSNWLKLDERYLSPVLWKFS